MFTNWTFLKAIAASAALSVMVGLASADIGREAPLDDGRSSGQPRDTGRRAREQYEEQYEEAKGFLEAMLDTRHAQELERREREEHARAMMDQLRTLRVRQVDLQRVLEHAAMDQDEDRAHGVRRELIEVEHELQRGQLELERLMMERERDAERRDLLRMTDRLQYVASWRDVAFDSPQAVMMATQAVVELHLASNDAAGAARKLEELLDCIGGTGNRTAVRFALKDIYVELDQLDRAVEHMLQVIRENSPRKD
jgi:hypothetical protein